MRTKYGFLLILLAMLSVCSLASAQPSLRWQPTLESAQRVAAQTNRLVLIHFWADYCGACVQMEREILGRPDVVAAMEANYVPVKVNAQHFPTTAQRFGVTALPTEVIIQPDGQVVQSFQGKPALVEYIPRLNRVAASARSAGSGVYAQIPGGAPTVGAGPTGPPFGAAVAATQPAAPLGDRYADRYAGQYGPAAGPAMGAPGTPQPIEDRYATGPPQMSGGPPAGFAPQGPSGPPVNQFAPRPGATPPAMPSFAQNSGPMAANPGPAGPAVAGTPGPATPNAQPPAQGNSPLGLDGFCPVALLDDVNQGQGKWTLGDRRWGVVHRGVTYLFSGPEQARRFYADPDRYAPVLSGNDIVLSVEEGRLVPGRREHGLTCGQRIYLFSSEASLAKFCENPDYYIRQVQPAVQNTMMQGYPPYRR